MDQPELADFVIREVNQNLFLTKAWFLVNGNREWMWGAVKDDAHCRPLKYKEAEEGVQELLKHDLYHGTWEICARSKKGVTLDKAA